MWRAVIKEKFSFESANYVNDSEHRFVIWNLEGGRSVTFLIGSFVEFENFLMGLLIDPTPPKDAVDAVLKKRERLVFLIGSGINQMYASVVGKLNVVFE